MVAFDSLPLMSLHDLSMDRPDTDSMSIHQKKLLCIISNNFNFLDGISSFDDPTIFGKIANMTDRNKVLWTQHPNVVSQFPLVTPTYHVSMRYYDWGFYLVKRIKGMFIADMFCHDNSPFGNGSIGMNLGDHFISNKISDIRRVFDNNIDVSSLIDDIQDDISREYIKSLYRYFSIINIMDITFPESDWTHIRTGMNYSQLLKEGDTILLLMSNNNVSNMLPTFNGSMLPRGRTSIAHDLDYNTGHVYNPFFCSKYNIEIAKDYPLAYILASSAEYEIGTQHLNQTKCINLTASDLLGYEVFFYNWKKKPIILLGEGVICLDVSKHLVLSTEGYYKFDVDDVRHLLELHDDIDGERITIVNRITIISDNFTIRRKNGFKR